MSPTSDCTKAAGSDNTARVLYPFPLFFLVRRLASVPSFSGILFLRPLLFSFPCRAGFEWEG